MDTTNPNYNQARRHVERKIGFLIHLTVYIIVNTGLVILSQTVSKGHLWPLGPLLGWGLGLTMHGLAVYLHAPGNNWKQRMIERELRKQ
jgi:hypothetical protein